MPKDKKSEDKKIDAGWVPDPSRTNRQESSIKKIIERLVEERRDNKKK
jgi:hypothetical protein